MALTRRCIVCDLLLSPLAFFFVPCALHGERDTSDRGAGHCAWCDYYVTPDGGQAAEGCRALIAAT